jgi:hypothetical protein
MKSTEHAIAGAVVSAVGVLISGERFSRTEKVLLWCYGVFLSVFIDLDHFVLARHKTGNWSWLFEALSHPKKAFSSPEWLFDDVQMRIERLLSHVVIGGTLTLLSLAIAPFVAVFTAVVVYTHLLCDLLRDAEVA